MLSILDVMEMKKRNDVEGLIRALQYQDDIAVRAEAASSLGELGDRQAVEPLISTLHNKTTEVNGISKMQRIKEKCL